MIKREIYLKKIRPFYDADLIKVITGIRRSGKSVVLKQIIEEIKKSGIKDENIIYINFEYIEYSNIKNYLDLDQYIKSKMTNNNKYYMFFDEIEYVSMWERVINSYKAKYGNLVSIFVTGSNGDLLSNEISTLLSGRYVSFKIYPLSFSEVVELNKYDKDKFNLEKEFNEYLMWGGLPQRFCFNSNEEVRTYLTDVYNSIIIKDIMKRYKINDLDLFNRIALYIVTTPSQTFSVDSLIKYFESNNDRKVGRTTLYNYLEYMCKAFLIEKADRYDVRGKRILTGKYKYYLTDLGLGQILNINKKKQMGAYLENVIYNELKCRGYSVSVGSLKTGEIDFIAVKDDKIEYYQSCYYLLDEDVIEREFSVFKNINDNYPKYVISMDKIDLSQDGIIHKNIIDWLLNK